MAEREVAPGRFQAEHGPVRSYQRVVEMEGTDDARRVRQTVDFRLDVPYFAWLFVPAVRRDLRRPDTGQPSWWAPQTMLDARASRVLGTLAAVAVVYGYLNTLFTQTIAFAGDDFHAGNSAQGVAGSLVRLGGLLALALVSMADRRGRRRILVVAIVAGPLLAVTGAAAPSLAWLTGSQILARSFSTTMLVLGAIVAGEEMPAGSRAWGMSLLAMASGLGAGICVLSLRLADLGRWGWRLLYVLPLLALPIARDVRRRLPESRRFEAAHAERPAWRTHYGRLLLLGAAGFLLNVFIAPDSQFGNRFLRHERHYSGGAIGVFSAITGSVGVVGIVAGGKIADRRGRRLVAAVALIGGATLSVAVYFSHGWPLWAWAALANVISDAQVPALVVYGPELFPTALRGRANGVIGLFSLVGSATGLTAAGVMADGFGRIGPAMGILALGPLLLAALVLVAFPETARRELEDLNPEDRLPPT